MKMRINNNHRDIKIRIILQIHTIKRDTSICYAILKRINWIATKNNALKIIFGQSFFLCPNVEGPKSETLHSRFLYQFDALLLTFADAKVGLFRKSKRAKTVTTSTHPNLCYICRFDPVVRRTPPIWKHDFFLISY